jgi:hypothetical protein
MSWLESYYPPVQKNAPVIKFKEDPKPAVKKEKVEKVIKVEKLEKIPVPTPSSSPEPPKVEERKPIIEAVSGSKNEKEPVKKGPKKPRFEKGSEEAKLWSKEMAIRKKVLKEMKPVVNTE